jgi:hypothetical protein
LISSIVVAASLLGSPTRAVVAHMATGGGRCLLAIVLVVAWISGMVVAASSSGEQVREVRVRGWSLLFDVNFTYAHFLCGNYDPSLIRICWS